MTTPQYALLALYAELDRFVENNPGRADEVERLLPGTTGPGRQGWSGQIEAMVTRLSSATSAALPGIHEALQTLVTPTLTVERQARRVYISVGVAQLQIEVSERVKRRLPSPSTVELPAIRVALESLVPPTVSQQERLESILAARDEQDIPMSEEVVSRLSSPSTDELLAIRGDLESRLTAEEFEEAESGEIESPEEEADEPTPLTAGQQARLAYILAALDKLDIPMSPETSHLYERAFSLVGEGDDGAVLRETFSNHFRAHHNYKEAIDKAFVSEELKTMLKEIGPPCINWADETGSSDCAVLRSDIRRATVTLKQVLSVLDPLNWDQCFPEFFCNMRPLDPAYDSNGWSRMLETTSPECQKYQIRTALKYWKDEDLDTAIVNYDLLSDDDRLGTGDNFQVRVDSGSINVMAFNGGVRVLSTKRVKIVGLATTAAALWTCLNGWSEAGEHLLFDCPAKGLGKVPWEPSRKQQP